MGLVDLAADAVTIELPGLMAGELDERLATARSHTVETLARDHALPHLAQLSYDPLQSGGMELIQGSALALNDDELAVLSERGFAIAPRLQYPSMAYGYSAIYAQDLPVFISADMVLEAVHRSYDSMLMSFENAIVIPELDALLASMQSRLEDVEDQLPSETAYDLEVYLGLAQRLLGRTAPPPAGARVKPVVDDLFAAAISASAEQSVALFGTPRLVDFSQFRPRGHYAGDAELEAYFRAMMWLGRTDFRLIETLPDGRQVLRPRQIQAALGLRELLDEQSLARWRRIDTIIGTFVGEHDYMTVPQLDELLAALGASDAASLAGIPEAQIANAIVQHQFGAQRIASKLISRNPGAGTLPLDASFAFFGQRYTVDSHVMSNLVYDRVGGGAVARVVPNPLDVAFAALGNDQSVSLLEDELATHAYAGDLAAVRELVDAHPSDYWRSSLYTAWLGALRTLSPRVAGTPLEDPGLPEVARTEGWGRRVLSTQLASWAELRHSTLLYAKQSYTSGAVCEFPDAYVDPYPELFRALARFAEVGSASIDALDLGDATSTDWIRSYFERLASINTTLAEMAENQRTGAPHTPEHLEFINDAISVERGCAGDEYLNGWYTQLFYDPEKALELSPTIADVHTDPGGDSPVARDPSVLHVGTGNPRLMIVTRESCSGPRAYAGVVFAYHEQLEPGFTRLTDQDWEDRILAGNRPSEVPWMAGILGPAQ